MGLMSASCTTPDIGSTMSSPMHFCTSFDADYIHPGLTNFDYVAIISTDLNKISDTIIRELRGGYCPVMTSELGYAICPHDQLAIYVEKASSTRGYIPSPYLEDGSRNPEYYRTSSPTSIHNRNSDFNGRGNTLYFCSIRPKYKYETSDGIINSIKDGVPAAYASWRYHTIGTKLGDWYIPSSGELGYVAVRLQLIKNTLNNIQNFFNYPVCVMFDSEVWFTSSVYGYSTNILNLKNGFSGFPTYAQNVVRPFTRFKLEVK